MKKLPHLFPRVQPQPSEASPCLSDSEHADTLAHPPGLGHPGRISRKLLSLACLLEGTESRGEFVLKIGKQ